LEYNTTILNIGWRLHSRQSFRINKDLSRNKEIERRIASGLSIEDIDPESRRHGGTSNASNLVADDIQFTTGGTPNTNNPPPQTNTNHPPPQSNTNTQSNAPRTNTTTTTQSNAPKTNTPTTTQTNAPKPHTEEHKPRTEEPKKTTTTPPVTNTNTNTQGGIRYDADRQTHWVENITGRQDVIVQIPESRQKVYIRGVVDSVITIQGKPTSISIENAKGSGIIFDDVIATVEVVNSSKLQLQANGTVGSIILDKTHNTTIFFQKEVGLTANIVTSQVSAINVCSPGKREEDDMIETPLPEQYVTRWHGTKYVTLPSEHSGV